jgi:uncharacterized protein
MSSLITRLADELKVSSEQVQATVSLLDEGATVPFIARYRKEATGGLDDVQLRYLAQRLEYLRDFDHRRETILKSLKAQNQLTDTLHTALLAATTKQQLEDIYLPYKPKRRTKAMIAREAGLAPLANLLLTDPHRHPEQEAAAFIAPQHGISDIASALDGARQILMEQIAEAPEVVAPVRDWLWEHGYLVSRVITGQETDGAKFADYFDYREPINAIPSHRALALFRGRNQGILTLELVAGDGKDADAPCQHLMAQPFNIAAQGRPGDSWLLETVRKAWRIKLFTRLDLELKSRLQDSAESEAITVFAHNLKDILLAAPAGRQPTMGLDPGLRTGVKIAIISDTGRVLETATCYPHPPQRQWEQSLQQLLTLITRHHVTLIAIGNGTASRETDRLVQALLQDHPELGARALLVSEAGASVYSASDYATHELPDLDVSLRGAVSIARRLQDPLAELVKIEPKAIGIGQYQHDVNQTSLARCLDAVVEDCVNAVGVDINTASPPLLTRVSGLSMQLAENIVRFREHYGSFQQRTQLLEIPRLGPKTFEQCAGFLRIPNGLEPLDASAVHPEAYPIARRIAASVGKDIRDLIGDQKTLQQIDPATMADAQFGIPTIRDILAELEKPGRDPRPEFRAAAFVDGVETIADLQPGLVVEGCVTNVTNFGAFVDIGVHQDGLVHVSRLADRFVRDPREIVRSGQLVRVKVLEIDQVRRRITLSMRLDDPLPVPTNDPQITPYRVKKAANKHAPRPSVAYVQKNSMTEAFTQAQRPKKS